ncbi:hypothetical protein ABZ746_29380 [Streptomyces sp. NPDC020096]
MVLIWLVSATRQVSGSASERPVLDHPFTHRSRITASLTGSVAHILNLTLTG